MVKLSGMEGGNDMWFIRKNPQGLSALIKSVKHPGHVSFGKNQDWQNAGGIVRQVQDRLFVD